ncbi:hypothetical protein DL768_001552 [Monosporascus sp. mg162]|nr:hypothetical protein DL768_001552 [Monosporascus sp. mg162]
MNHDRDLVALASPADRKSDDRVDMYARETMLSAEYLEKNNSGRAGTDGVPSPPPASEEGAAVFSPKDGCIVA